MRQTCQRIADKYLSGYSGRVNNMLHIAPVAKHARQALNDTLPILRRGLLMRERPGRSQQQRPWKQAGWISGRLDGKNPSCPTFL